MVTQLPLAHFEAWLSQAQAQIAPANTAPQPVVLDVREPWEVQTASVSPQGFELVHVPMQSIPAALAQLQQRFGLAHPIACLCHHGMRSLQVANYLTQSGFSEVVNLQGGIEAWSRQVDPQVPVY